MHHPTEQLATAVASSPSRADRLLANLTRDIQAAKARGRSIPCHEQTDYYCQHCPVFVRCVLYARANGDVHPSEDQ